MNARTVVAWIVRFGLVPGKGRYHNGLAPPSDTITSATRYVTANGAADVAFRCGGRVVALVRREPRDWAKLVEEHAALTEEVARLTANHAEWLRLLADTRAALGVEAGASLIDVAKRLTARAEEAERMVETQRAMLAFDATPGTVQRLLADLADARARLEVSEAISLGRARALTAVIEQLDAARKAAP